MGNYQKFIFKNKLNEKIIITVTKSYLIKNILLKNKEGKIIKEVKDIAIVSKEKNNEIKNILNKFFKNCEKKEIKDKITRIINEYRD